MSRMRRRRAVVWGTLLLMAWLLTIPATSGAFPIRWYDNPTIGDPDQPGGGRLVRVRFGSYVLSIGLFPSGNLSCPFFLAVVKASRSSRGATL